MEPIKGTDSKAEGCNRALPGAGATLASVAGVGRGLKMPHVHQNVSCSSGKAACSAVPRANAADGDSCRTQGRTKHSLSCFAGAAGSLPGWCARTQTQRFDRARI